MYTFSERSLNFLSKSINFMSVEYVALILSAFMSQSCHVTHHSSLKILSYIYGIICFKFGPWGSKWRRIITTFLSYFIAEISWAKVQYANVGLQPEISQQRSNSYSSMNQWCIIAMLTGLSSYFYF